MSDTILTMQCKSGSNRKYDQYLRIEYSHGDHAGALRQLLDEPDEHAIGLPPVSAASHLRQKQKRKTEQDEPEMPGV
jgi:hypothetical protein